jgi:two-component system sensor kinase FixL
MMADGAEKPHYAFPARVQRTTWPPTMPPDPGLDYRSLFETVPGLYLILNPDLTIAAVNKAYGRATMIEPDAVIERNVFEVFPDNPDSPGADGVSNLRASLTMVLRTRQLDAMAVQKYDIRRPDGTFEERHWSCINVPVLSGDGAVRWIIHRAEDVTELVKLRSESAIQNQIRRDQNRVIEELRTVQDERSFLADLVESSNDAIVSRTNDGKIRSWNRAAELMFGFSAAEMIGRAPSLPPELQAEAAAVIARLHRGEAVIQYMTKRPHKDGREIDVSFTASLIRNPEGRIVGTSGILRDITEQKVAEAARIALQNELAHVSRLSAMGQMSAAIAHELNQPLSAMSNFIAAAMRIIENEASQSPRLRVAYEAIEKAGAQTFRAAAIIRSLRDFVERRDSARAPQNLSDLIREAVTLGMLGHQHSNVRLAIELDPGTPLIPLNKVQIQQVLVNLVRNALEAMALTDRPELKISSASDKTETRITVRDNGPGFSAEIAGQLFQPFVTSKEAGMGMGLRICESIVEAHGGTIEAANADPGAVFVVTLPHRQGDGETA